MKIQLSDHFNYKKMLLFTLPSIFMMIFTSIYGVVDGYFVSNFVGKTPFAAVNFILPVVFILNSIGFMLGSGGGALIAKTLGEKNNEKAQKLFSMFVYISLISGIILGLLSIIFIRPIALFLGAKGAMLENCVVYAQIILAVTPLSFLQFEFQSFFVVAEKPKVGLYSTIASGVTNMVLDVVFIALFHWGIVGAALATALSQAVGGIFPLVYFSRDNSSLLRLGKPYFNLRALLKASANGSSEFLNTISMSIAGILYNVQLMKYAGENGIAAYGVLMYVSLAFLSVFIGYSIGISPVISYHYGAQNHSELKNLRKKSNVIIAISSVCMLILSEALSYPLSYLFVGYDSLLMEMTVRGFFIFSFSFLFSGFAIFPSAFFTALNDGLTSAIISFLRSLLFQVIAVLLLPLIWGIDGIWSAIVVSEAMAVVVSVIFLITKQKKFKY